MKHEASLWEYAPLFLLGALVMYIVCVGLVLHLRHKDDSDDS